MPRPLIIADIPARMITALFMLYYLQPIDETMVTPNTNCLERRTDLEIGRAHV